MYISREEREEAIRKNKRDWYYRNKQNRTRDYEREKLLRDKRIYCGYYRLQLKDQEPIIGFSKNIRARCCDIIRKKGCEGTWRVLMFATEKNKELFNSLSEENT